MSHDHVLTPIALLASHGRPVKRPVIALSEGEDHRIIAGGVAAVEAGIADIILVGRKAVIRDDLGETLARFSQHISIHDPVSSELSDGFAAEYLRLRAHKGVDHEHAAFAVNDPLIYSAMLVHLGHADGTVGGAVATTSDVVRHAIQVIGKAPDAALVSSFFLIFPPESSPAAGHAMVFSDCGLVIDPSVEELASIAGEAAASCSALLEQEPRVAMLSFSTKGSAHHPAAQKMIKATELAKAAHPQLKIDGELQFDAAISAAIGDKKAPGSDVAGRANVMIFPDLDAGNIAYKVAQRVGGARAIGPILQGLAKPANDLSRGCSAEDVTEMIAVTILQGRG